MKDNQNSFRPDKVWVPKPKAIEVNHVWIVDRSTSMGGEKYLEATRGVDREIKALNRQKQLGEKHTFSIVEFSSAGQIQFRTWLDPNVEGWRGTYVTGLTALYDCIVTVIMKLQEDSKGNALIKVLTDGAENDSMLHRDPSEVKRVIEDCDYTVTFTGRRGDMDRLQYVLGIDPSMIQYHEDTGESIKRTYEENITATTVYLKRLRKGEQILGFYNQEA